MVAGRIYLLIFHVFRYKFAFSSFIMKVYWLLALMFCVGFANPKIYGQSDWKFVTEKQGIKVSSRFVEGSKVKALRVDCRVQANTAQVVALLLDIDATVQWVYHTKSCKLIRQVSPSELYYYSEVSLPWPLENRDFVARVKVTQNPATKVVTVDAPAVPGWVKQKEGIVRVSHSVGTWILTPLDEKTTKIQYTLQVDPGGVIPAWLVNTFAAQGPIESFKKMKDQLTLSKYRNISLPFIQL